MPQFDQVWLRKIYDKNEVKPYRNESNESEWKTKIERDGDDEIKMPQQRLKDQASNGQPTAQKRVNIWNVIWTIKMNLDFDFKSENGSRTSKLARGAIFVQFRGVLKIRSKSQNAI